jgi:hypothetical protein
MVVEFELYCKILQVNNFNELNLNILNMLIQLYQLDKFYLIDLIINNIVMFIVYIHTK